MTTTKGKRPLYRVRFVGGGPRYAGRYYSEDVPWKGVPKVFADEFPHRDAVQVQNRLRQPRIGLATLLEPVKS